MFHKFIQALIVTSVLLLIPFTQNFAVEDTDYDADLAMKSFYSNSAIAKTEDLHFNKQSSRHLLWQSARLVATSVESDGGDNGSSSSCIGNCGGSIAGACYCDSGCVGYRDCCSDYEVVCTSDNNDVAINPIADTCTTESPYTSSTLTNNHPICVNPGTYSNDIQYHYIYINNSGSDIVMKTAHGTGNAELYYNNSTWASASNYTASSTSTGNVESITRTNTGRGYHYLSVQGEHFGVTLLITLQ